MQSSNFFRFVSGPGSQEGLYSLSGFIWMASSPSTSDPRVVHPQLVCLGADPSLSFGLPGGAISGVSSHRLIHWVIYD